MATCWAALAMTPLASRPSAEAAANLVKQYSVAHLLYPGIPTLLTAASAGGNSVGLGPSPAMISGAMAVVGLLVGVPNFVVAINSNHRLEEFFRGQAWSTGRLESGQTRRGLVFLHTKEPLESLRVRVLYRGGDPEQALELSCPAPPPR